MLTAEENELLTRIGQGTAMGEVLRRYWHPVGWSEWVTTKPQRVKVLGEELVLYRGQSGRPALMQLRCAHRSVALDYGRVEGDCIRCPYHGWLYDAYGQCLEQPAEPAGSRYKDEIRLRAYPTQEMGGLVFAYMGPEPAPLLPLYDLLRLEDGVRMIQVGNVNANWMNHVENIVDISHLAWLHGYTLPGLWRKAGHLSLGAHRIRRRQCDGDRRHRRLAPLVLRLPAGQPVCLATGRRQRRRARPLDDLSRTGRRLLYPSLFPALLSERQAVPPPRAPGTQTGRV
jgi:phenylpropionate dioxygenase-like ring-hydroxylating dioxygenase large terminal subunit